MTFRSQTHTILCLQWINQHCSRGHKPVYRVFRLTAQLYIYHADLSAFLPLDDMPSNMPQQIWSAVQDLAGIDSGGCIPPYCIASTASHASNCTAALALHNKVDTKEIAYQHQIHLAQHPSVSWCFHRTFDILPPCHLLLQASMYHHKPAWSQPSTCLSCCMNSATFAPLVMPAQCPLHTIWIKPSMPSDESTVHDDLSISQLISQYLSIALSQ